MKRSLRLKLILSFLVVALVTVLVVSALIRLTSGQSLMNLVVEQQTTQLEESVTSYYTANSSLDGFFAYYVESRPYEPHPDDSGDQNPAPGFGDIRGVFGLVDADYRAIMPTFGIDIGQQVPADMIKNPVAVKVNGETIAWILPDTKFQFKLSAEEELFLKRTSLAIGAAAAAGVAIAILMGVLLTGYLVKPIQRLTAAAKALAEGDLKQQVPVTSQDELGLLT
ncbi:MAG TPA: HAMP domain-containing protein, partial [Anaerolineaceae bacterium]|nr:HAMP domain-containing protein [Anaerolineaceae bacterium]